MNSRIEYLSKESPIRFAIVGAGGVAQVFHLPLLTTLEDARLVAICDIEEYKLSQVARKYEVPGYVDIENMLKQTSPDVVIISTPTISHLPLSLTALRRGAHVIVEKPVTMNYEQALRLQSAAHEAEKQVLVAMKHRFREDVTVLRNFITSGELGRIWRVRAGWLRKRSAWARTSWLDEKMISGGGVLMDLGIEMLDLIDWMLGTPEIERILSFTHHEGLNREVEDTITGMIIYKSGITFQLDCSWGLLSEEDVAYSYFEGTAGSAQLNPLNVHKTIQNELVTVSPVHSGDVRRLFRSSFRNQIIHFIAVLRGEEPPVSTIDEAIRTMRLVHILYQSAQEGREIRFADSE